jgi:hypothetical protein
MASPTPGSTTAPARTTPTPTTAPLPSSTPLEIPGPKPAPFIETVSVSITSQPPGAEVYLDSEPAPRGRTPVVLELPHAKRLRTVKLLERGYAPSTLQFSTASDVQLGPTLVRQPAPVKRVIVTHPAPAPLPMPAPELMTPSSGDDTHQLSDPFNSGHKHH